MSLGWTTGAAAAVAVVVVAQAEGEVVPLADFPGGITLTSNPAAIAVAIAVTGEEELVDDIPPVPPRHLPPGSLPACLGHLRGETGQGLVLRGALGLVPAPPSLDLRHPALVPGRPGLCGGGGQGGINAADPLGPAGLDGILQSGEERPREVHPVPHDVGRQGGVIGSGRRRLHGVQEPAEVQDQAAQRLGRRSGGRSRRPEAKPRPRLLVVLPAHRTAPLAPDSLWGARAMTMRAGDGGSAVENPLGRPFA